MEDVNGLKVDHGPIWPVECPDGPHSPPAKPACFETTRMLLRTMASKEDGCLAMLQMVQLPAQTACQAHQHTAPQGPDGGSCHLTFVKDLQAPSGQLGLNFMSTNGGRPHELPVNKTCQPSGHATLQLLTLQPVSLMGQNTACLLPIWSHRLMLG